MLLIYLGMLETEEEKNKFEQLYLQYRKLMFMVAKQILKDDYLAEDAVHQVFVKITDKIKEIDTTDCHKTSNLFVIMVRNQAINMYHQNKRRGTVAFETLENVVTAKDWISDIENPLISAISKLPDIYRDILTLKGIHDYSNGQIASYLSITEATVRKRLERARKMLRVQLEGIGESIDF